MPSVTLPRRIVVQEQSHYPRPRLNDTHKKAELFCRNKRSRLAYFQVGLAYVQQIVRVLGDVKGVEVKAQTNTPLPFFVFSRRAKYIINTFFPPNEVGTNRFSSGTCADDWNEFQDITITQEYNATTACTRDF